jgi:hypothetical protein
MTVGHYPERTGMMEAALGYIEMRSRIAVQYLAEYPQLLVAELNAINEFAQTILTREKEMGNDYLQS